jgi:hypothetical protein
VLKSGGRKPRRITFIKAKLRKGDGWADVQIGNVSRTGLMLRSASPPAVGERIELRHRGWGMTGSVVWRERSRVGIEADTPIDEEELLAASGIGRPHSEALHDQPRRTIWHWLRRR